MIVLFLINKYCMLFLYDCNIKNITEKYPFQSIKVTIVEIASSYSNCILNATSHHYIASSYKVA